MGSLLNGYQALNSEIWAGALEVQADLATCLFEAVRRRCLAVRDINGPGT